MSAAPARHNTVAARTEGPTKTLWPGEMPRSSHLGGVTVANNAYEFTAVMGPFQFRKSTLMHCAAGLDEATSAVSSSVTLNSPRPTSQKRS